LSWRRSDDPPSRAFGPPARPGAVPLSRPAYLCMCIAFKPAGALLPATRKAWRTGVWSPKHSRAALWRASESDRAPRSPDLDPATGQPVRTKRRPRHGYSSLGQRWWVHREVVDQRKRKIPTAKTRLEVFKTDRYTCQICGRSPAITPGLELEVDHRQPFSKCGADSLDNYQTLCQRCNRGKGDRAELNRAIAADVEVLLDQINPAFG
jgi:5-methylcytosine-specific restriction endonuclease McrA